MVLVLNIVWCWMSPCQKRILLKLMSCIINKLEFTVTPFTFFFSRHGRLYLCWNSIIQDCSPATSMSMVSLGLCMPTCQQINYILPFNKLFAKLKMQSYFILKTSSDYILTMCSGTWTKECGFESRRWAENKRGNSAWCREVS